jgi:hypothetical protein
MMRTLLAITAGLLGLAALVAGGTAVASSQGGSSHLGLQEVRAATAAFRDVEAAKQAGYTLELKDVYKKACIANLNEPVAGAMGVHMVNPTLLDGVLDPLKPEALVYEKKSNGTLKLAAVEYVTFKSAHPTQPTLFSIPFDSNLGSRFFTPAKPFWSLHAWVWKTNPSTLGGVFSPWNPRVSCSA